MVMKVSMVIPVRDEEASIRELLDSLLAQTHPLDEILITDGGSVDATPQIVEEYIRAGAPLRLIRSGPAMPGRGRNLGAEQASHEWLAFTDAGNRLNPDWLERMIAKAESDAAIDVVYGGWHPVTTTFFKECAAISYVPPPRLHQGVFIRPRAIASSLMRRDAWRGVNGFPEDLRSAEDLLFMERLDHAGYVTALAPEASASWDLRPTLWTTFKRFLLYSRNNVRAGLFRQWQQRILMRYAMLTVLALAALIIEPRWLWFVAALWFLLLVARVIVSLWRNRVCSPASLSRNLVRGAMIMSILVALDVAAILGCIKWLLLDSFRWSRKTPVEAGNGA